MASASAFFNHIRGFIAAASWFTSRGFTNQTVYRQFLPQVKDPLFPCITLGFDPDKRDFADIDTGTLYVGVHTKSFPDTETVANKLKDSLHQHQFSDDTLIIYKCDFIGGTPMPMFDKSTAIWEVVLEFECWFGDGNMTGIPASGLIPHTSEFPYGLNDLFNVDAETPTDGNALVWDAASDTWIPGEVVHNVSWDTLSGVPETFTPEAHATSHQNGQIDEISVEGLSGLLADPQTPVAHDHDASYYTETELQTSGQAQVNYGNLSEVPETFAPEAHATSHQNGQIDEISVEGLSGLLADPQTPVAHDHDYSGSFLGLSAKAADSDRLDGHDTAYFAPTTHVHNDLLRRFGAARPAGLSNAILYTVPTDTIALIKSVTLCNTSGADALCRLFLVPTGGTADEGTAILYDFRVPQSQSVFLTGLDQVIEGDGTFVVRSSVGDALTFTASGLVPDSSFKRFGAVRPANTNNASLYTVPVGIVSCIKSIVLCNTTAVDTYCRLFLTPTGGTADESTAILHDFRVPQNQSVFLAGLDHVLEDGGQLIVRSSLANALTFTASGQELSS